MLRNNYKNVYLLIKSDRKASDVSVIRRKDW